MPGMRAALLEEVDTLRVVDDVEIEAPRSGEVLVRISHCGVCHSDLHFVDGSLPAAVFLLYHTVALRRRVYRAGATGS